MKRIIFKLLVVTFVVGGVVSLDTAIADRSDEICKERARQIYFTVVDSGRLSVQPPFPFSRINECTGVLDDYRANVFRAGVVDSGVGLGCKEVTFGRNAGGIRVIIENLALGDAGIENLLVDVHVSAGG